MASFGLDPGPASWILASNRLPLPLQLGTAALLTVAPFLGPARGFRLLPFLWLLCRSAQKSGESLESVLAVFELGTISARLEHQDAIARYFLSRELAQPFPNLLRQGLRFPDVEVELNRRGHFVDMLAAGSAGADEAQLDLPLIDLEPGSDLYHTYKDTAWLRAWKEPVRIE